MLQELIKQLSDLIVQAIRVELGLQGHKLTGKLIESIEAVATNTSTGFVISILGEDYIAPVNNGVPAANIPFSGRSGRGGTSKYIQGLRRFAQLRFGVSERKALSIAFAIANKHKREGMPTRASRRFSKTGRRTGAVQVAIDKVEDQIEALAGQFLNEVIVREFELNIKI